MEYRINFKERESFDIIDKSLKIDNIREKLQKGDYKASLDLVEILIKNKYEIDRIKLLITEAKEKETRPAAKNFYDSLYSFINDSPKTAALGEKVVSLEKEVKTLNKQLNNHVNPKKIQYGTHLFTLFLCGALYLVSSMYHTDIKIPKIEKKLSELKAQRPKVIIPAVFPDVDLEKIGYTSDKDIMGLQAEYEAVKENKGVIEKKIERTSEKPLTSPPKVEGLSTKQLTPAPSADYSAEIKKMDIEMKMLYNSKEDMKTFLNVTGKDGEGCTYALISYYSAFQKAETFKEKEKYYKAAELVTRGNLLKAEKLLREN